jgi:hypothetical protein
MRGLFFPAEKHHLSVTQIFSSTGAIMKTCKRWLRVVLFLGILMALIGIPPFTTAQASTQLFYDDFSGDLSSWMIQNGSWKVTDGQAEGIGAGGQVDGYMYAGDSSWTDYSLATKVTFVTGEAEFRLRSTGLFQNEYRISIWADNVPGDYKNTYAIGKYQNGSLSWFNNNDHIPFSSPVASSASVRLDVVGNSISLYINNVLIDHVIDAQPLPGGKFGVGVIWNWTARFDDVTVTDLSDGTTIMGHIATNKGIALPGVSVSNGTRVAMTDNSGNYYLNGVAVGDNVLIPFRSGFAFEPPSGSVTLYKGQSAKLNFMAVIQSTSSSGEIITPQPNEIVGDQEITISANAITSSRGINSVTFLVFYNGSWHTIGFDNNYPYMVAWKSPSELEPQQLMFAIHVTDLDGTTTFFADTQTVNFVDSLNNPQINENWVPNRVYLNQRVLDPHYGDSECSVSSMVMVMATEGIIDSNYASLQTLANNMFAHMGYSASHGGIRKELAYWGVIAKDNGPLTVEEGWEIIKKEVDAGRPIIVRTGQNLSSEGHYIVAMGYKEMFGGRALIAYDPFGKWLGSQNYYLYNNSKEPGSHVGKWVIYNFDSIFPDSEMHQKDYLITAQPIHPENLVESLQKTTLLSPPDMISDEPAMIAEYLGVPESSTLGIYLPLIAH